MNLESASDLSQLQQRSSVGHWASDFLRLSSRAGGSAMAGHLKIILCAQLPNSTFRRLQLNHLGTHVPAFRNGKELVVPLVVAFALKHSMRTSSVSSTHCGQPISALLVCWTQIRHVHFFPRKFPPRPTRHGALVALCAHQCGARCVRRERETDSNANQR